MLCLRMGKLVLAIALATLLWSLVEGQGSDVCYDRHAGPCKRSSQCSPLVTLSNSTHLRVSWKNVFEGCEDAQIKEAILAFRLNNKISPTTISIKRGQENVSVEANPCLSYSFQVLLFMTKNYSDTYVRESVLSAIFEYNSEENENYPYSGLLATELLPKICVSENRTITIPDPPKALQNCGVASSDVEDADFEKIEESSRKKTMVKFVFNNPQRPGVQTSKIYEVLDIQRCQPDITSANLSAIALAAIVISSTTAVCVTICLLVFCLQRWLMAKQQEKEEKQDENKIYGLYYNEDGQDIDQGTVEVFDVNDYYG